MSCRPCCRNRARRRPSFSHEMMDLIALVLFLAYLHHQERRHERRAFERRVRLARPQPTYRMSAREREYSDVLGGIRRRGPNQNVVVDLPSRARVAATRAAP